MTGTQSVRTGTLWSLVDWVLPKREAYRCEFCGTELFSTHDHIFDSVAKHLLCVCCDCHLLLTARETPCFQMLPKRVELLRGFQPCEDMWQLAGLPLDIAILERSHEAGVTAIYPTTRGPVEVNLGPDAWRDLVRSNPVLTDMRADVEALLVYRIEAEQVAYRLPIDDGYRLVDMTSDLWCGFGGGRDVWRELGSFFSDLHERAHCLESPPPRLGRAS